eukprot:15460688-Alexandrium_andersonii.AAC.1
MRPLRKRVAVRGVCLRSCAFELQQRVPARRRLPCRRYSAVPWRRARSEMPVAVLQRSRFSGV